MEYNFSPKFVVDSAHHSSKKGTAHVPTGSQNGRDSFKKILEREKMAAEQGESPMLLRILYPEFYAHVHTPAKKTERVTKACIKCGTVRSFRKGDYICPQCRKALKSNGRTSYDEH